MALGRLYKDSPLNINTIKEYFYQGEEKQELSSYDFFLAIGIMDLYKEKVIEIVTKTKDTKESKIIPIADLYKTLRAVKLVRDRAEVSVGLIEEKKNTHF